MQHCMNVLRLLPDQSWPTSSFLSKVCVGDFKPIFTVWGRVGERLERRVCLCDSFWKFVIIVHKVFIQTVSLTVMNAPVISYVVP